MQDAGREWTGESGAFSIRSLFPRSKQIVRRTGLLQMEAAGGD